MAAAVTPDDPEPEAAHTISLSTLTGGNGWSHAFVAWLVLLGCLSSIVSLALHWA